MKNLQLHNVGNFCDRVKHAALVQLAHALATRHPALAFNHLETHAFLLHAPLADPNWQKEMARTPHLNQGLYQALEFPQVRRGRYLCSTGLVLALHPQARCLLAERHGPTRRKLLKQLAHQGAKAEVRSAASAWRRGKRAPLDGVLLALIDPFRLDTKVWRWARKAVTRWHCPENPGVLLVFDYAKQGTPAWPAPHPGWHGPVAWLEAPPCFLAAYGCGGAEAWISTELHPLGWRQGGNFSI